jgi:F-type H+-transporting ATPase subunit delta
MPLIEKRYAEALLKLSDSKNWIEDSLKGLKSISDLYSTNPDLKAFLNSPEIKSSWKKDALKKILVDKFDKNLINFILFLIDKGRIKNLPTILEEYILLSNKAKNILEIEIITSEQIAIEQIMKIENKYKKLLNTTVIKSKSTVDKSLIGGVKIIIGDKIYDNSIKAQLLRLRTSLNMA